MLLEWMDIGPDVRDMSGLKPLLRAARDGYEGVVMVQLEGVGVVSPGTADISRPILFSLAVALWCEGTSTIG